MTKEIFPIARYEGRQIEAVNIEKVRLDDNSDVYFMRSDNGGVEKVNPTLVMTRRGDGLDSAVEAARAQDPEKWVEAVEADVTIEIIKGDATERRLQAAVLAHAALVDTLIDRRSPINRWIREMGDETVGIVDPDGVGGSYDRFEMPRARVIVREIGARGVRLADGFQGDAWDALGNYSAVMGNAAIMRRANPLHIPRQQSLDERVTDMDETVRKDYEHLDTWK